MSRMEELLEKYGEVCTRVEAGEILRCHYNTVRIMIQQGKLKCACQGRMVDVRSIVEFIEDQKDTRKARNPRGSKRREEHAGHSN